MTGGSVSRPGLRSAPGWSPFLGQVRLASIPYQLREPLPPILPEQPALGDRYRMGEFAWNRVPTSVLLLTGGVGAIYLGGVLPNPVDIFARVAGIAAAGYGLYYMFNEPEGQKMQSDNSQKPQNTPPPSDFNMIKGTWISPVSGTKPSENFWTTTFDAKYAWYNDSPNEVSFTYDILVNSITSGIPQVGVNYVSQSVYTNSIKLAAKADSGPLTVQIPIFQPPKPGISGYGMPDPTFRMELILRKFDKDGNPVPVGDTISVGPWWYKQSTFGDNTYQR